MGLLLENRDNINNILYSYVDYIRKGRYISNKRYRRRARRTIFIRSADEYDIYEILYKTYEILYKTYEILYKTYEIY